MKKLLFLFLLFLPCIAFGSEVPKISGKNAIAIEVNSGRILYEKNAFNRANIASTTKIMTAIVAVENNDLNSVVNVSKKASRIGGSSVNLISGDNIKLSELLYGLMLRSGNDAAIAIAEHTSKDVKSFCELMNKKAKEIGAFNTNFVSPHGLDSPNHFSTAYDMAIIAKYALNIPTIRDIVSTKFHTMKFLDGKYMELKNTNPLLFSFKGCTGMKTGYTAIANRCLIASAKRDNFEVIVVNLGEPSSKLRIVDTTKILNYCFDNYKLYDLRKLFPIKFNIELKKGVKESVIPIYRNSLVLPLSDKEKDNVYIKKFFNANLTAPISINQVLGEVQFKIGNDILGEIELCCPFDIKRKSIGKYYSEIFMCFLDFKKYIY